ncbi:T9SS type A sorting domain-containing protein [Aquimarina sp. ERC-38]|uniref:T9SS type A sorting domain-containing protein n=1 Tax=Aquimarina sp. ERC-38 TaxID=2949996 RepID=UPI00224614DF|nr:T9SS type A sorting domain-containing protein [Aquimarina sp. ERC-38]UZO81648.1 T9SS type A sorting domain-containing protein [Aquimarina sp. ERC-38]
MQINTLTSKRRVLGCVLSALGFTTAIMAQTTPPQQGPVLKGHQLYKMSKIYDSESGAIEKKPQKVADRAIDRLEHEFNMVKNPYTNQIPENIKNLERNFSENIEEGTDFKTKSKLKNGDYSYFKSRGPFNVGGRTRALAIDVNDENIILAGGVSGGLWRSENSGVTWSKVSNVEGDSQSITYIIQDTTSLDNKTWYYGSGEFFGNSASASSSAPYQGNGVYKSIDGGLSWKILDATNDNSVVDTNTDFDLISRLAINPINSDLYVSTTTGIQKSSDKGLTFDKVLDTGDDNSWTDVVSSPSGKLYATVEFSAPSNKGFFTSADGETWTNITPEGLESFGRVKIEIDPNNENTVYFFARNTLADAYLFRYNVVDSSYTDLTANIPRTIGAPVGNLNLQFGYNMVCEVKPGDPNFIILGGTNLYRSTTGYTTPAGQESWIAGYSPVNDISTYTNQHPDQHMLIYYPSNPDKVLSGNDGGVYITEDITTANSGVEPVSWIDLNNGYLTTQPYHVSFDPSANSDDLIAGFQDNSTWYTNSTNSTANWVDLFSGDGSYSAIADGGLTRYVSSQRGRIFRFNYDENGIQTAFTRIQPEGAGSLSFVAPFILDKNNDNIMYLPNGNTIWRNNNLDEVPLFSNSLATEQWSIITSSVVASGNIVSLDVSKYPVANRLYYGTSTGLVYRMDNANLDNQPAIDISTGKGLPAGNVNDINVDPSNPDRVIITFSNYGIPSLFFTKDGGETWTDISGNLEENPDGTGNGPSVRSTAFFGSDTGVLSSLVDEVFAATSTGVYYTLKIDGANTKWYREPFVTNGTVADEIVTRKDGFIAVATHGNGVFSAKLPIIGREFPESNLSVINTLDDITAFVDEDPDSIKVNINNLFLQSQGLPIEIEITNTNSDFVTVNRKNDSLVISYLPNNKGSATIGLIATSNGEQVSTGFTLRVLEVPIYEQNDISISTLPSQFFTDFDGLVQAADDFTIPEGYNWEIEGLLAFGSGRNGPPLNDVRVIIYEDDEGVPGNEIFDSEVVTPVSERFNPNIEVTFDNKIKLNSGDYWISIYAILPFRPNIQQWSWETQDAGIGRESHIRDENDIFGAGAINWTVASLAFGRPGPLDQKFQIFGNIEEGGVLSVDTPLVTINNSIRVSPNPSNGIFTFSFADSLTKKNSTNTSLEVYNILGTKVYYKDNITTTTDFIWDASDMTTGLYLAKIGGKIFRVLKK